MSVYKTVAAGDIAVAAGVFVHYFLYVFPPHSHQRAHFSETEQTSLFLLHFFFMSPCCVNRGKALNDFVSGCTEVRATVPQWCL